MHDTEHHQSDMKAGFMGLIFGAIALLIVITAIVKLTNAHYNGKEAAAEATR
jgi:hypothetical protein